MLNFLFQSSLGFVVGRWLTETSGGYRDVPIRLIVRSGRIQGCGGVGAIVFSFFKKGRFSF